MTAEQKELHTRFLDFRTRFRAMEVEFIKILQEVERTKLHRAFGCPSVFKYAVDVITFSESVAYTYILVARKASQIPALVSSGLSVSKASRIVSALTPENSAQLIEFALTHTPNEIDREVARRNPKGGHERMKSLSDEYFELKIRGSKDLPEKLKRVEALQTQRGQSAGPGAAVEAALDEYLRRYDPVQKAERARLRKETKKEKYDSVPKNESDGQATELCLNRVQKIPDERTPQPKAPGGRLPLSAEQKHVVHLRDGGTCTHVNGKGERCASQRWLQIHHVVEVCRGGSNDPENLTTLCSFHHDLVHQLSLPLEGQVSWLRSPSVPYTLDRF